LSDVTGSLGSESSWLNVGGNSIDLTLTLLGNLEGNNSKVWATDATSDRLSLSFSGSSWSVSTGSYFKN
jgi:hypothetical protein